MNHQSESTKTRASGAVRIKRAYEPPAKEDGYRVLVDRLWPRGVAKAQLHLNDWLKEVAPSDSLRRWFSHDPAHWDEFVERYRLELQNEQTATILESLAERTATDRVTLVYGARDPEHNHALVLLDEIARRTRTRRGRKTSSKRSTRSSTRR